MRKILLLTPTTAIAVIGFYAAFSIAAEPETLLAILLCLLALIMAAAWIVASEI